MLVSMFWSNFLLLTYFYTCKQSGRDTHTQPWGTPDVLFCRVCSYSPLRQIRTPVHQLSFRFCLILHDRLCLYFRLFTVHYICIKKRKSYLCEDLSEREYCRLGASYDEWKLLFGSGALWVSWAASVICNLWLFRVGFKHFSPTLSTKHNISVHRLETIEKKTQWFHLKPNLVVCEN